MIGWYMRLLYAEQLYRDAIQCWLKLPDGSSLVLLDMQYPARLPEVTSVAGIGFQVQSFVELEACYHRFAALNLFPVKATCNGFCTSLMYQDPHGNLVSIRLLSVDNIESEKTIRLLLKSLMRRKCWTLPVRGNNSPAGSNSRGVKRIVRRDYCSHLMPQMP